MTDDTSPPVDLPLVHVDRILTWLRGTLFSTSQPEEALGS
jgi:hypothetical protein